MESPKSLFLRIQIGLDTLFIEGEPYGNPVGREQAHDTKGSDPSSGIPAEVDDEAVDLSHPSTAHEISLATSTPTIPGNIATFR